MFVPATTSDDNVVDQVGLLTSKVWHVHCLEQMAGEQASQMADMKYGLQQTSTYFHELCRFIVELHECLPQR